jgi:hypothetical protein
LRIRYATPTRWRGRKKLTNDEQHRIFPAGLGANDLTFEGGKHAKWPPLPWFVPYLIKYVYFRRYAGSWRFSPCTLFGQPKELPFVVDEK